MLAAVRHLFTTLNIHPSHGIDHALAVMHHAQQAAAVDPLVGDTVLTYSLNRAQKVQAIEYAALLHDVDDAKFSADSTSQVNARALLRDVEPCVADTVLYMITLVSCRTNGNQLVEPAWLLLPRWADRLEAMGEIGLIRCREYSRHIGNPIYTATTPRAMTESELWAIATPARFAAYNGVSASMVDHCYDKLCHLGFTNKQTSNEYLLRESAARQQVIIDYCLGYGRDGSAC